MSVSDAVNQVEGKPHMLDAGVTVSFSTGSTVLDTNGRGAQCRYDLDEGGQQRRFTFHGYADTTGNSEANLALSESG